MSTNQSISGVRLELGRILAQCPSIRRKGLVHFNLSGQRANSLLHDGHAWKEFSKTAPAATRRAIQAAIAADATLFVHASFAFVHAVERGAMVDEPLRSCVDAILECEAMASSGPLPACIVRLGYLYGPESADLLAYRKAFRLGRPYWSGRSSALQYHIHQFDAASALLAVARPKNAGNIYYATDGHAISFERFMDAFAHRVGRSHPLHLPLVSHLVARVIIREEHMQQTALGMPPRVPTPRVPGWKPDFSDYGKGIDQVIETWQGETIADRALRSGE
jgi:nucleoside-diphosphate-sugar epimerase